MDIYSNDYLMAIMGTPLTKLSIFSDGCASQFKNRFILSSLGYLQCTYGFPISWSFFATSHGKGAVDGIGGAVKRGVWIAIKSRRITIDSAKDFAFHASEISKQVKIFYIDKNMIDVNRNLLKEKWSQLRKIPNLQMQHFFEIKNNILYFSPVFGSTIINQNNVFSEL